MSARWPPGGAARRALGQPPVRPGLPERADAALARAELDPDATHLAWELVRLAGQGTDAELALTVLLQDALARGSTRLSLAEPDALAARARALFGVSERGAAELAAYARAVAADPGASLPLIGPPGAAAPLVVEGTHLYAQRVRAAEVRLVERLRARLEERTAWASPGAIERALVAIRAHPSGDLRLTDEQEAAVRVALEAPLSVIRGGPGTGKTSVVVAILRAAARLGVPPAAVAIAAPTGKAADRARSSIAAGLASITEPPVVDVALRTGLADPRTLHRLLGYSPRHGGFRHHADNPLAERLVIVDESSMIDLLLMDDLLRALRPEARLVLLGDAQQLPSVAAGAVFRDLGRAPSVPGVALERSHRMDPTRPEGFNILSVARAIQEGRREPLCAPVEEGGVVRPSAPDRVARLESLPAHPLGGAFLYEGGVHDFLAWWRRGLETAPPAVALDDRAALAPRFAALDRARLLCVTRAPERSTGVEAINAHLHGPGRWRAGEPVLVHRNDYARGLFNGDQGLLLDVLTADGRRLSAVFRRGDGFVAHPLESVRGVLELGYATTVHKAQGSEHDVVAILLPETDSPRLLTREVIYTGLTRARRAVVLVGDRALLDRAVHRAIERSSGVSERLARGPG